MKVSQESANASILMLGGAALVMLLLIGLSDLASFFLARSKAQTAADAAALAAVAELIPTIGEDPQAKAEEYASANGAELVRCACSMASDVVEVTVVVPVHLTLRTVDAVHARAKAEIALLLDPP